MITVGLISHSVASANLGVGALTVAEIEILRDAARRVGTDLRIKVLDWKLARPAYVAGDDIEIFEMTGKTLISPTGYWAQVRSCDMVIDIGAGDSFADIYGPKRLRRMMWMKYLVHLARRPLVLAPQTYGPFEKPVSIRATAGTLRRSALVASRDEKSTDAVAQTAPGVSVIEASDVALRLPYTAPAPRGADGPVRVGLNVSGLLMGGGYSGANMFGLTMDYAAMIRELIARLQAHEDAPEIHLVPHVAATGPGEDIGVEDDRIASLALAEEIPGLIVSPAFQTPSEAKSYIADLDFFAGARMHACIAAFSSGVPVVPMAYSRKFEGLFGTLGYRRTVDCTTQTAEVILDQVMAGFSDRIGLAEEMAPALKTGLEKLGRYESGVEAVMAQVLANQ